MSNDVSLAVREGVKEEWFTKKLNKKLWRGIIARKKKGKDIDFVWARGYLHNDDYTQALNQAFAPMNNKTSELQSAIEILKDRYIRQKTKDIIVGYHIINIKDEPNLNEGRIIAMEILSPILIDKVELIRNNTVIKKIDGINSTKMEITHMDTDNFKEIAEKHVNQEELFVFYYARIFLTGENMAWSSPIWIIQLNSK